MVWASGLSDTGCSRPNNQDRISILLQSSVFVVADGMGGERCGGLAAEIAVESVGSFLSRPRIEPESWPYGYDPQLDPAGNSMWSAIQFANQKILERSREMPECQGMGSTISAVNMKGRTATIGTLGDSRVYLSRLNTLVQLTRDDSVVARLIDAGELSPEDARVHPLRNVLTQAAGKSESVTPQVKQVEINHADRLLLSSDGLHGVVTEDRMCEILNAGDDIEVTVRKLVAEGRKLGAPDNLSCVLVEYFNDF
jgi:serine/threonine protein phosphatase PrpC